MVDGRRTRPAAVARADALDRFSLVPRGRQQPAPARRTQSARTYRSSPRFTGSCELPTRWRNSPSFGVVALVERVHPWMKAGRASRTRQTALPHASPNLGLDRHLRNAYAWRGASISPTGQIRLSDPMRTGAVVDEHAAKEAVRGAWISRPCQAGSSTRSAGVSERGSRAKAQRARRTPGAGSRTPVAAILHSHSIRRPRPERGIIPETQG